MLFGHNTNVTVGGAVIHVQTEDRGTNSAVIDTTVYHRGRVLHRRTSKYSDLLPLTAENEKTLKTRLDQQHSSVVEDLRSGAIPVNIPQPAPTQPVVPEAPALAVSQSSSKILSVDLLNPRTWLTGKQATLYLIIRSKESGTVVAAATVTARVDGAADRTETSATTNADGHAQLQFEMPRLTAEDAALVIEATTSDARGQLRFQLRAKPKVPTT